MLVTLLPYYYWWYGIDVYVYVSLNAYYLITVLIPYYYWWYSIDVCVYLFKMLITLLPYYLITIGGIV